MIGPVPAALTREGIPHSLRSIAILPAIQLIAAVGIDRSLDYLAYRERVGVLKTPSARRLTAVGWVAAFAVFGGVFLHILFNLYPAMSAPAWEYGYREAIAYLEKHRGDYEEVVISSWAEYADTQVLFYSNGDLKEYQKSAAIPGYRFLPFGHSYQRDYVESNKRALYLLRPFDQKVRPPAFVIKYPTGEECWAILEHPGKR